MFDIDKIQEQSEKTRNIPVGTRPDGVEVGFTIYGPQSEAYRRADRRLQVLATEKAIAQRKTDDKVPTDAEIAERVVAATEAANDLLLGECVAGWYGFQAGGADAPFTPANLEAVLRVNPKWKKRLVNEIEDGLSFTEG